MEVFSPRLLWILFLLGSVFGLLLSSTEGKPTVDWDSWLRPSKPRCEPIKIAACKNEPYNMTVVPNSLGHRTQAEAGEELAYFAPLMKVRCSEYFQQFLCLLYAPVCTIIEEPIPPCRSLCKKAKKGCVELLRRFGFEWPEVLRCNKFPKKKSNSLCTGINGGKKKNRKNKNKRNKKGKRKKGGRKQRKRGKKRRSNKGKRDKGDDSESRKRHAIGTPKRSKE